jgi:threonine dehydratase
MMKRLICTILAGVLMASCALMKNLDDAYTSKDIQKGIKELGSYVDTLKSQNGEHYTYRILALNAQDMVAVSEVLSRKALDSYFRRMSRQIGEQSEELYAAASRKNAEATKAAIEKILKTWGVIEEYIKPS